MRSHVELIAARIAGAGLLAWMAWIHLHLWHDGYQHLHIIGILFLLNFIGAVGLALVLLAVPGRSLALVAAGGFLMFAGTLVSLVVSVHYGLFGFKDSWRAEFVHLSIWVEGIGAAVLLATAIRAGVVGRGSRGRGPAAHRERSVPA